MPITHNCVFAMRLDTKAAQEHIVIGEPQEVLRFLRGGSGQILTEQKRPFGSFIVDCSAPISGQLADVRAILSDSTGKKNPPTLKKAGRY